MEIKTIGGVNLVSKCYSEATRPIGRFQICGNNPDHSIVATKYQHIIPDASSLDNNHWYEKELPNMMWILDYSKFTNGRNDLQDPIMVFRLGLKATVAGCSRRNKKAKL